MSGVRKSFFQSTMSHHFCGMPRIFLISTDIFIKRKKLFFISKEASLEAASLACISNFVDRNAGQND